MNRQTARFAVTGECVEDPAAKGRFRKRSPHGCGRARCGLCHGDKLAGKRTVKQLSADEAACQQLADLT